VDEHLEHDGLVILSRIVEWNRGHVLAAYEQAGYQLEKERQSDEWVTFMLRKRR